MAVTIPEKVAVRALERWVIDPESGCHISTYSLGGTGYPQIGWWDKGRGGSRMTTAHRAAWVATNGPIPDGMTVDHVCKNRRCVNPEHLRLLTNFENARRTSGWDWPLGTCRNGHPNSLLQPRRRGNKTTLHCPLCLRGRS